MLYPDALAQTLPMLGKGMVGIFLVIGAIAVVIWLLNKLIGRTRCWITATGWRICRRS